MLHIVPRQLRNVGFEEGLDLFRANDDNGRKGKTRHAS